MHEVYKHYLLLEDFSYKYEDKDIEAFWGQKQWPFEISAAISVGSFYISQKQEIFSTKLESEKDQFLKCIEQYKQAFEKIKKFRDLNTVNEFAQDAYDLRDKLDKGFD